MTDFIPLVLSSIDGEHRIVELPEGGGLVGGGTGGGGGGTGPQGAGVGLSWNFDSATGLTGLTGGAMQFNSDNPADVTEIAISEKEAIYLRDVSDLIGEWDAGYLHIIPRLSPEDFYVYLITTINSVPAGYNTYTVSPRAISTNTFSEKISLGDKLVLDFSRSNIFGGTSGATGLTGPDGTAGPPGPAGGTGNTGTDGPQGTAGPPGTVGNTGTQGVSGPQGDQGGVGTTGNDGIKGVSGPQGAAGTPGPPGDQGSGGDDGVKGVSGPQGVVGDTGVSGEVGIRGVSGPQGVVGDTGVSGEVGIRGVSGLQGVVGDTGVSGEVGIRGVSGLQGVVGDTGTGGAVGDAGVKGPQGGAGPAGPDGSSGSAYVGPQGQAGAPVSIIMKYTATAGTAHHIANDGVLAFNIATGSASTIDRIYLDNNTPGGRNLEDWYTNWAAVNNTPKGTLMLSQVTSSPSQKYFLFEITNVVDLTTCWGVVGSPISYSEDTVQALFPDGQELAMDFNMAGDTGPQGIQGTAGTAGTAGDDGAIGATGFTGPQGTAGTAGDTGPQGIQGTAGTAGDDGAPGADSTVAGPQGTAGDAVYTETQSWVMTATGGAVATATILLSGDKAVPGSDNAAKLPYTVAATNDLKDYIEHRAVGLSAANVFHGNVLLTNGTKWLRGELTRVFDIIDAGGSEQAKLLNLDWKEGWDGTAAADNVNDVYSLGDDISVYFDFKPAASLKVGGTARPIAQGGITGLYHKVGQPYGDYVMEFGTGAVLWYNNSAQEWHHTDTPEYTNGVQNYLLWDNAHQRVRWRYDNEPADGGGTEDAGNESAVADPNRFSYIQLVDTSGGYETNAVSTSYIGFNTIDASGGEAQRDFQLADTSTSIQFNTSGTYEISFNIGCFGTGGSQRTGSILRCEWDNGLGTTVNVGPTSKTGYIRITTGHDNVSYNLATWIFKVDQSVSPKVGEKLRIGATRETTATGSVTTVAGESYLYIRRVF